MKKHIVSWLVLGGLLGWIYPAAGDQVVTERDGQRITCSLDAVTQIKLDPSQSHDHYYVYRARYPSFGTEINFTAVFEPVWQKGQSYEFIIRNTHLQQTNFEHYCPSTDKPCPPENISLPVTLSISDTYATNSAFAFQAFLNSSTLIYVYIQPEPRTELEKLALSSPAGIGPRVFTRGWPFEATCLIYKNGAVLDYSDQVTWSGSGVFTPSRGRLSRPVFNAAGANTIILSINAENISTNITNTVQAVSPKGYAALGHKVFCPADAHGSPSDPMPCGGYIISGSPNVMIGTRPAARVGDVGIHAACNGPNRFVIVEGDPTVLIDGCPAARKDDLTRHCGGMGQIIEGETTP